MPAADPINLQLDELHVVSDLHLGGKAGFQIFASGPELAWLARSVATSAAAGTAALLINGDFIDFLAEEPKAGFDPVGAASKVRRVLADPAFTPVFDALRELLATPRRRLIVNLGNHDLELALPWVREPLTQALCGQDDAARARLLWLTNGTGVRCQVGAAQVLCVHGNEIDAWNVTDHEHLRRLTRDLQFGLPPEPWMPNAGSQLVVEVMNQIKASYPFVDLLKPETQAVVPILTALNPALWARMKALGDVAARVAADSARLATGMLGADGATAAQGGQGGQGAFGGAAGGMAPFALPMAWPGASTPAESAAALLAQAEQAFSDGIEPISLVRGQQADQLGFWSAAWDLLRGKSRAEVLRDALEFLDKDTSFDPGASDDTFKQLDARIAPEIDLLLAGHTHLARSLPRSRGGQYFNSGTWAGLMRITPEIRRDPVAFDKVFKRLGNPDMASLENPAPGEPRLLMRLNTVVSIWVDGNQATQAELRGVQASTVGGTTRYQAVPVAGTRYTQPKP